MAKQAALRRTRAGVAQAVGVFVGIVLLLVLTGAYFAFGPYASSTTTQSSSTTTTSPAVQGVVTGYVTVGPAQPVCSENQSCNVDLSGYSLVFTAKCTQSMPSCPPPSVKMAQLSPAGHYSILLAPGDYDVTGLYPSCKWVGCSSAFPQTVTVESGMQLVFNVSVDTGIR